MAKKNTVMSVTASVVIASSLFGAQGVEAASYKVKPGDNLWSIAQKYNTTVPNLKSWNKLSNEIIFPNQTLEIDGKKSANNTSKKSSSSSNKSSSSTNTKASNYTVKSGDSLSKIAANHGISLSNLMKWNNLKTSLIFPGDSLVVSKNGGSSSSSSNKGSSSSSSSSSNSANTSASYTVKSGDTLGQIASKHGISLSNLMKWNNLNSHLIHPGKKLVVKKGSASSSSNKGSSSSSSSSSNASKTTYTVKSGDNLSKIASNYGVSVNNLMSWNNLSSHIIYPGNKLTINGKSNSNNSSNSSGSSNTGNSGSSSSSNVVSAAKSVLGTSYVWGGATTSGFDCSGFIYWAFNKSGEKINRLSTDGYYNRSYIVNKPSVGDLVFFEGTYRSGISHMGIYLGNNEFIHAGTSTGVTITSLDNPYWKQHFHSYKRFY